uniref:E3 ubiquitin-protein ligase n=1 Tax=Panagrolaimus superbus TaxID=310955 RepID=A0A914YR71_9BILA
MNDDENPNPSGSRHQFSFSLERDPIVKDPPSNSQRYITQEDIKKMDEIAQNLSKHGCSFLESTVCSVNGCPKDMDKNVFNETLRNEAKFLHEKLNTAMGYLEIPATSHNSLPNITSLNDLSRGYLKLILSGNGNFEDFINKLKKYHSAVRCNVVWRQNTVAYRCHTCGLNSCMSLCAQCFEEADHEGHDYSRFFSTVGGCCDCGNCDVMNPKGFCPRHCEGATKQSDNIPPHSLALLKTIIAKLISRTLVCLRRWCIFREKVEEFYKIREPGFIGISVTTNDILNRGILPIINFITELSDAGSAVTDILIEFFLDKNFYHELCRKQITSGIFDDEDVEAPDWRLQPDLKQDIDSLKNLQLLRNMIPRTAFLHSLTIECVLDELILYLIRIAFPQELIDMLLNLLYDTKYKEHFAKKFFSYYPYITAMVAQLLTELPSASREGGKVAERIVHISVQICSGSNICSWLQKEIDIIQCVLRSAIMMSVYKARPLQIDHSPERFFSTLPSDILSRYTSEWIVVSIEKNPFYEKNADLFVLTDTQNLLVHQPIAKTIFISETLVEMYIRHIELFQGFTTEWRIASGEHRTHDWVVSAQRSYNVEFEACSLPMHNLLQHATTPSDCQIFYSYLLESLNTWFKAIKLDKSPTDTNTPPYAITFHIPLHRHLATLIFQMQTYNCSDLLKEITQNQGFLRKLILHPIRIHVARAQYYAGMWLRNGQGMRIAVSHYCKPTITFSFQSADLIILRFAASNINQEYFLTCIINSFSLLDCFAYPDNSEEIEVSADSRNLVTRKAWVSQLLDGALRLLLDLIIGRRDTEADSNELVKEEMITLLARQDLPYSHVKAVIPSRGNICFDKQMEVFDEILNEVANFVEPDQDNSLQHGRYELKKEYFDNNVCPVFCRLRSFGALDYSEFVNRVDAHERTKSTNLPPSVSPWLGYRLYNFDQLYANRFEHVKSIAALLTQPSFFALMHQIINKVLTTDYYYSLVLQQAIYLLTLSIQFIKSNIFKACKSQLYHPNEFNEPAFFSAAYPSSIREAENPQKSVIKFFLKAFDGGRSILVMLVELFVKSAKSQCPTASDRHIFELLKEFLDPIEEKKLIRIHGAGMEYVGRLLNILLILDVDVRREVYMVIDGALAEPTQSDEMEVDSAAAAGSFSVPSPSDQATIDRKAQLKAKKEAFLKKLQVKNSKMMQHHMETEGITQEEMNKFDTKTIKESTYQCPICSETTNHSLSNPIGLFVHTRPHAVIPNSLSADEQITDIMQLAPTSSSSSPRLTIQPRRRFFDKRDELCLQVYSKSGTSSVKSLRFRTGIEVRTCNHFAHLSCFKSYVDSIRNNPSPVIQIHFNVSCPMCRTPVNTILPLKMEYGREKIAADFDISDLNTVFDIKEFYSRRLRDPRPIFNDEILRRQSTEYRQAYEDFEDIAYRQLRSCYETPDSIDLVEKRFKGYSARLGYVQSNIDKLIMFTSMGLPLPSFTKGSVSEHILSGAITLSLSPDQDQILTHFNWLMDSIAKANYDGDSEMPPLLICDYQSVYLRCVALPLVDERFIDHDRKAYCLLLYRVMTTLALTRAIQNTISKASQTSVINEFIQNADFGSNDLISQSLQKVYQILRPLLIEVKSRLFLPFGASNAERQTFNTLSEMIEYTKKQAEYILSYFMKFVFMLNKEVTKIDLTAEEKSVFQLNDLEGLHRIIVGQDGGDFAVMASSSRYFLEQLILSLINGEKISQILVSETFNWRYRQLLNLPKEYDKLFSAFFGQKCENCHKSPRHQMLCLLCGAFMCLNRCNESDDRSSETETYIERHTISCGAGCACYLSLNSTMIVINYYRVAVLWGTVYLDSHGEEDRNLIRGKPLFLSDNRIKQLQRCWLTQDLENRSNLRWFSLDQLSLALKQSHHNL